MKSTVMYLILFFGVAWCVWIISKRVSDYLIEVPHVPITEKKVNEYMQVKEHKISTIRAKVVEMEGYILSKKIIVDSGLD